MAKARIQRRKSYVEKYGPPLVSSSVYQQADDAPKTKLLDRFAAVTQEMANEVKPDFGDLRPEALLRVVKRAQKATETRRRNERRNDRKRLIYAPAQ